MELRQQLNQQRVKYIISSYQLDGDEPEAFYAYLHRMFHLYPAPLIELALVAVLVNYWLRAPMQKGCQFLALVYEQLSAWEEQPIVSPISPEQFQQITGLDPTPIFGPAVAVAGPPLSYPLSGEI